ncbi:hypothetical protein FRC02_007849 [Tulasnella sp. 418]|nr:hypothetical protein FRC02_007849 [Tulasnella sp. 418]
MLDLLGAIGTTISLVTKIKTRFDKVGQNKHECALLSSDAINSLLKIKEFLERPASCPSQELRNCLSELEIELNNINASLRSMIKPEKMCILGTSMTKIKDLYNADDVQHELVTLRQKVEACHRHLHTWSTVRTESKIADLHNDIVAGLEEQKASMRELRNELRMLIPGLTPTREAALEQIQDEVSERHSMREDVCPSQLELVPVQSRISSQPVGSIRSARLILLIVLCREVLSNTKNQGNIEHTSQSPQPLIPAEYHYMVQSIPGTREYNGIHESRGCYSGGASDLEDPAIGQENIVYRRSQGFTTPWRNSEGFGDAKAGEYPL